MRDLGVVLAVVCVVGGCAVDDLSTASNAVETVGISSYRTDYTSGTPIIISWTGAPGANHDWIGLAASGSSLQDVGQWIYTGGAIDGTTTFRGMVSGHYVARIFADDSYVLLAETPFNVTGSDVITDSRAYVDGPIEVTWDGLSEDTTNWVDIAPVGSPPTTVTAWVYTDGFPYYYHFFNAPAPGSYVARSFLDDSYTVAGESLPFEVGTTLTTNPSYAVGDPITVTWNHTTPNPHDWISLATSGSAATSIIYWTYTGGETTGNYTFSGLSTGTYVARFYINDSYTTLVESAAFDVR